MTYAGMRGIRLQSVVRKKIKGLDGAREEAHDHLNAVVWFSRGGIAEDAKKLSSSSPPKWLCWIFNLRLQTAVPARHQKAWSANRAFQKDEDAWSEEKVLHFDGFSMTRDILGFDIEKICVMVATTKGMRRKAFIHLGTPPRLEKQLKMR